MFGDSADWGTEVPGMGEDGEGTADDRLTPDLRSGESHRGRHIVSVCSLIRKVKPGLGTSQRVPELRCMPLAPAPTLVSLELGVTPPVMLR